MKRDFRSWLKDKHVAVVGLGVSGEGMLNTLQKLDVKAYVFDKKIPDSLLYGEYVPTDGEGFNRELQIDLAVISPGIPLSSEQAQYFIKRGIPLMGEIEFAYCLTDREFICITGTNGKTTTTSLCGEIFKRHTDAKVVGNIGIAAAPCTLEPYDLFVAEISSFQIETLNNFRAKICAVLNITPDHLDRHGSFEAYTALKLEMLKRGELKVVNADCPVLVAHVIEHASDGEYPDLYLFSAQKRVEKGAFVEDGKIYVSGLHQGGDVAEIEVPQKEWICDLSDIRLMGAHNVENVLAAVLIARLYGVAQEVIRESIIHFRAVEHRIEFVRTLDDVRFYNDSKGTNPDSTIKAIEAMDAPCHLIAGGYEKNSDFTEMLEIGKGKISSLSLIGVTAERIRKRAVELGYHAEAIGIYATLKEAVHGAFSNARSGEIVLLSPASASWGMYKDFEERGRDFKSCVAELHGK